MFFNLTIFLKKYFNYINYDLLIFLNKKKSI